MFHKYAVRKLLFEKNSPLPCPPVVPPIISESYSIRLNSKWLISKHQCDCH